MKRSKNTQRALLLSAVSMLLCLSMLVGTTFAWFTDSVTSGRNKIVAGNLDMELYAKVGGTYTKVTEDTKLFREDTLWEPGHVEVINLKIENCGTLALKYRLGIHIVREQGGVNVAGDDFQLSDFINFALIKEEKTYTSRDEAVADAEKAGPVRLSALVGDDSIKEPGVLYPWEKATPENPAACFVTLVVYMPTTVDNKANYKTGTKAPEIELGVTLLATQTPYEEDSFNDQYDANADFALASLKGKLYPSLKSAFADAADGDTIHLLHDATTAQINFAPETSKKVTVDMGGHNISTVQNDNKQTWFMMIYKPSKTSTAVADVTFKNGTIDCYDNGFWVEEGTKLTLENVKLNAHGAYSVPKGKGTYAIYLTRYANPVGITVLLKDSEITSTEYGIANWNENCNVMIDGCKIKTNAVGIYQNGSRSPAAFTIKNSQITDTAGTGIYISNTAGKPFQTLTIENCTVTGPTAVEVKHTNATITGSVLIASSTTLSAVTNGSGSCTAGYALAVTSNNNSKKDIVDSVTGTVTVTDSKLYSGSAEGEPNGHVFVYKLKEGASVTVNGTHAATTEKYDNEPTP